MTCASDLGACSFTFFFGSPFAEHSEEADGVRDDLSGIFFADVFARAPAPEFLGSRDDVAFGRRHELATPSRLGPISTPGRPT